MPRPIRGVPQLQRRENGYFYATWYDPNRRRTGGQSLRTKDPKTAQNRFAAFLQEGSDIYESGDKALTVSEGFAFYESEHVDRNVVDYVRFTYCRDALVGWFGKTPVRDVDNAMCQEYIAFRTSGTRPVAATTAARDLGVLNAMIRHNYKFKRVSLSEIPKIELGTGPLKREVWLMKDEMRRLLDTARGETQHVIGALYYTGSRRKAIERLEWAQVNFDKKTVALAKRGEKLTKKRRPVIPMVPELETILRARELLSENEYVFGSPKSRYRSIITTARKASLLHLPARDGRPAGRFCPHAIRHTRATHMLEDGVDIYAVAKLLGDTVRTVERTYGHATTGRIKDAILQSSL